MPFSFIEIEESKSRVISFIFLFIILFYFVTAYLILVVIENTIFERVELSKALFILPSFKHTLAALTLALLAAAIHWTISTSNLIEKMSLAIGALPADPKDTYHQYFNHIVDEVSVAVGGLPIEAMVIPSPGMNAFSLQDFQRRAVIGVTEGLLARLNRAQIEAVVAHEAGHIASGDCLSTTVNCSLSEIYEEVLTRMKAGMRETKGRGSAVVLLIFIVLTVMTSLSKLLKYFISRQREYRADAIAVRLTRDPLSLAEALKLISRNWRGSGAQGEKLESIFIVNPRFETLDEEEGLFADIFSTHPPVNQRINILLGMAHLDEKTLEENLKNFTRVSPVALAEFKTADNLGTKKWFIFQDQKWQGPFLWDEVSKLGWLTPSHWIRMEGINAVIPVYQDEDLQKIFKGEKEEEEKLLCPHCKIALDEISYEGVPILKCSYCAGVFVEDNKVSRIFIREDNVYSKDIEKIGQSIFESKDKFRLNQQDAKTIWIVDCPKCQKKMRRQFFAYSYPIEIDRCIFCSGIWFDKLELEILQYIYERKDKFFDTEKSF